MIQPHDLMDAAEVCEHFGCAPSSLRVAMSSPTRNPKLARRVPPPLRKVGGQWVWRRTDIEGAYEREVYGFGSLEMTPEREAVIERGRTKP